MLIPPIKILQTIQITEETDAVTFDDIANQVAEWDAAKKITSRHLVLIINARSIDPSDYITNFLRFNGDPGMTYRYQRLSAVDVVDSAGRVDGANAINLPPIQGDNIANAVGGSMVVIPHAFNDANHKAVLALGGASEYVVEAMFGRWASPAAITSVTIFEGVGDDFVVGSTFHLGVVDERYLIEEITPTTPEAFNIPQGQGDLAVIIYGRTDRAAAQDGVAHSLNDDITVANYARQYLRGNDAARAALNAGPSQTIGIIAADNATPNAFGALVAVYSQYTKDNQPHFLSQSGTHDNIGPGAFVDLYSTRRPNIEPINKIQFAPAAGNNFMTGTLISLYRVPKRIIQRVEVDAPQVVITFGNIPQHFEALILHIYARTDAVGINDGVNIELNGDGVAANYNKQFLQGVAAVITPGRTIATQNWFQVTGDGEGAGEYGGGTLLFPGYAETDRHKHCIILDGRNEDMVRITSARWLDLAAITQIIIASSTGADFMPGTVAELEGVLRHEGLPAIEGMGFGV